MNTTGGQPVTRTVCLLTFALLAPVALGEKFHDIPPGGPGGICLHVKPIEGLEKAIVVEPTEYKAYLATINRSEGTVSITGLPPGKYDLILKYTDKVYEGLTLDVPGGYEKLSPDSRKGIEHRTWISEDYFNEKRIVRMGGNNRCVKAFIEQIRDLKTFEPSGRVMKGMMIRRFDLCELRRTGQIWQIKMNRHLFREERKIGTPGTRLEFFYVPALGGIRVADEVVTPPPFDASRVQRKPYPYFYRAHYRAGARR